MSFQASSWRDSASPTDPRRIVGGRLLPEKTDEGPERVSAPGLHVVQRTSTPRRRSSRPPGPSPRGAGRRDGSPRLRPSRRPCWRARRASRTSRRVGRLRPFASKGRPLPSQIASRTSPPPPPFYEYRTIAGWTAGRKVPAVLRPVGRVNPDPPLLPRARASGVRWRPSLPRETHLDTTRPTGGGSQHDRPPDRPRL